MKLGHDGDSTWKSALIKKCSASSPDCLILDLYNYAFNLLFSCYIHHMELLFDIDMDL